MGGSLFGGDEDYLETGTCPLAHGEEVLVVGDSNEIDESRDRFDTLRTALAEMFNTPADRLPSPRPLGGKRGRLRRRVVAGKCFEQTMSRKTNRWYVVNVDDKKPYSIR